MVVKDIDSKESGMKFSNTKALTSRVLVALTLTFISLAGLPGKAEAATCFTCHAPVGSATDIRPVESTYRNITTGSIRGSHAKHIPAPTLLASACNPCHGSAASGYDTKHRDGFITVTSAGGIGYSKPTSFPQSGSPTLTLGSCSTASCHDNGKGVVVATPVWGATGVPACTACHALIPGESHTKHVSTTTYKKAVCADCHTGYVLGTTAAANHLNNTVEVNVGSYPSPKAKGSAVGTCSTSYCHSSGQSADGLSATPVYASVTWGGTVVCGSCHATTTLATGTHAKHLAVDNNCDYCHSGAYTYGYASANHVNGQIEVTSMGYTAGGAPGNGYGTCSTAICHGSIAPPAWGVSTNNDSCTKCHGTGTVTVTAANKYVIAPADANATDKGQVSSLPKVGAHQTHLQFFNGLSQQGDNAEARCVTCHGPLPTDSSHVTGMSFFGGGGTPDPTTTFNGLATTSAGGTMTPTYSAGSCSNTYCHNPAGTNGTLNPLNAGTATSPSWTNAGYLGDTLKTNANCNTCHKSPGNPSFTSTTDHSAASMPLGIATVCTDCHGHDGGTGGVTGQQHMDGIKYGGGNCDSCHSYDTVGATFAVGKWTGGTWGKSSRDGLTPTEGYGAHAVHINYIKGYLGIATTMTAANQVFGAVGTNPANVCGTCHSNLVANHSMGGSTVRTINFGDGEFKMGGAAGASLLFGSDFPVQNPKYNGVSGTSSATTAKTCSNLSCHYFTTPAWSTY
jgi:predicted CxxxxCH...CXXCH cytochrome family protein